MNRLFRLPKQFRNWASIGILVVAAISIFSGAMNKEIFWLSTSEAEKITSEPDNKLETLKCRVIRRIPQLRRWFYGKPPTISLETITLTAPETLPEDTGLGQPMATNSSGVRVWTVAPAEVSDFYAKFLAESGNHAYYEKTRCRISLPNGTSCFCTSREMTYSGKWDPSWSPPPAQDDIEINMIPIRSADFFQLTVAMKMVAATSCTNSPFGFVTRVPNLGVAVVDCGIFRDHSGHKYWLLVAPSDAASSSLHLFY
jgi:hypothetical protein